MILFECYEVHRFVRLRYCFEHTDACTLEVVGEISPMNALRTFVCGLSCRNKIQEMATPHFEHPVEAGAISHPTIREEFLRLESNMLLLQVIQEPGTRQPLARGDHRTSYDAMVGGKDSRNDLRQLRSDQRVLASLGLFRTKRSGGLTLINRAGT